MHMHVLHQQALAAALRGTHYSRWTVASAEHASASHRALPDEPDQRAIHAWMGQLGTACDMKCRQHCSACSKSGSSREALVRAV